MASGFVFMLYITFYGSAVPCYPTAHCLTIISFMGLILKLPFSSLSSTEYAFQMKVQRIVCKMFIQLHISCNSKGIKMRIVISFLFWICCWKYCLIIFCLIQFLTSITLGFKRGKGPKRINILSFGSRICQATVDQNFWM